MEPTFDEGLAPAPAAAATPCTVSVPLARSPIFAPRRASSSASPRPMPEDAPVIKTTLLDQSMTAFWGNVPLIKPVSRQVLPAIIRVSRSLSAEYTFQNTNRSHRRG